MFGKMFEKAFGMSSGRKSLRPGFLLIPSALIFSLVALSAVCSAQDTNFSQGPQYLMNYGDPHFLHPIQTPSLDLSAPRSESPNAPSTEHTGVPDSAGFDGLRSQAQVDAVYYGTTPIGLPLPPTAVEIDIPVEPLIPSPPTAFNAGVRDVTTANSLRDQGYGISLAQDASYWRAHKPHHVRLYTNADIARLHGG